MEAASCAIGGIIVAWSLSRPFANDLFFQIQPDAEKRGRFHLLCPKQEVCSTARRDESATSRKTNFRLRTAFVASLQHFEKRTCRRLDRSRRFAPRKKRRR